METLPPKKAKVEGSSDEEPQIKPIKPKAVRKRAATKKASVPEVEVSRRCGPAMCVSSTLLF